MRFAIIAAGEGSRLAQEGVEQPKPLVKICGEPMIDRLMRIFIDCGATEIVVIVNEWSTQVQEHLESLDLPVPLRLVVKNTPSSMHSLHALSPYLRGEPFCLTTVDTIFQEKEFKDYIKGFRCFMDCGRYDGCMAITPHVDDEKPLWVSVDENTRIINGFHDKREEDDLWVSGGIYGLNDKALDVLDRCIEQGMSRMRNFQRQLVAEGLKLFAFTIEKIMDVDHKDDIAKAEHFIQPLAGKNILGICRNSEFSPNCVSNDAAIMEAVKKQLEILGAKVELKGEDEFNSNEFDDWEKEQAEDEIRLRWYTKDIYAYFNMARSPNSLAYLFHVLRIGIPGINDALAVTCCMREKMVKRCQEEQIPMPLSFILHKGDSMPADISYPCWLKRGLLCAQQKEDTCFCKTPEEAEKALKDFWERGNYSVVACNHLKGDLIKFYGVEGTIFFHWFYPSKSEHRSKFGLEEINGVAQEYHFDPKKLKNISDRIAKILYTPVYGGDCIVDEEGNISIIDFNDWPSFAPCREKAAYYIAQRLLEETEKQTYIFQRY